ncbi:MAG: peptidylprolyl isomerase [Candidatus Paceibacteria bacterium]
MTDQNTDESNSKQELEEGAESNEKEEPKDDSTEPSSSTSSSKNMKSFVYGIIAVIVVLLLGGWGFVKYSVNNMSENPTIVKAAKVLKIPAATVNGDKILYSKFVDNKKTLEQFYGSQPQGFNANLSDDQISQQIISRLVANKILEQVAEERGIKVTQKDIKSAKDEIKKKFPSEDKLKQVVQNRYGWTMDKYVENVIRPTVLKRKVKQDYLSENSTNTSTKNKAEEVLQKAKNGQDFKELASQYGSKKTKQKQGELGWFGRGVMVPKFEQAAFGLEPGEVAPNLVKTKFGYHIIKVEDKRTTTTQKGEKEQVKARHILFENQNQSQFRQYMNQKMQQADIQIHIPVPNPFKQKNQLKAKQQRKGTQTQGRQNVNKEKIKKQIKKQIQQQQNQQKGSANQQNNDSSSGN